ncbi:EAL domain-containing protein [Roseofilum casamattae]|uniref:EAL domain-containing protein n=1 Tax=Roseofilum casamattae BLCC-M143 TaxID=3022442 RepID=A0ABT7BZ00_9CYAN|nr:EAL domain-containing protein [Roseofilum casamattae]MDJ1184428.1 EAL domain-containing protein [Roseofilum casamattae BLCC-M143]
MKIAKPIAVMKIVYISALIGVTAIAGWITVLPASQVGEHSPQSDRALFSRAEYLDAKLYKINQSTTPQTIARAIALSLGLTSVLILARRLVGLAAKKRKGYSQDTQIHLLYQLTQVTSQAQDFDEALAGTMKRMCEEIGWDIAEAWIPSLENTELCCSSVWYSKIQEHHEQWSNIQQFREISEQIKFSPQVGLPGRIWCSKKPEWIDEISQESGELFIRGQIAGKLGIKSGFGVPIIADTEVLAILVFFMQYPQPEDQELIALISSVAIQLGSLFKLKQAEAKYRSIFENSIEGIFQTTPNGKMIGANPALAKIYGYSSAQELLENLADVGSRLYVNPESREKFQQILEHNDVCSNFEAEIYRKDGSKIWISERARAIRDKQGKLLYYEGSVVNITEQKERDNQLHYYATHDSLTGLMNRAYFLKKLAKVNNERSPNIMFAVMFIDLDGFKTINDSMGHWVGDLLLIAIAWTLQQCISDRDILARLGGDEFTILLKNIEDVNCVLEIADRIHERLRKPFQLGGNDVFIRASIGIAYNLEEHHEVDDILRNADIAMYRAKKKGKNCTVVFDRIMREEAMERMQIETDLRLLLSSKGGRDRQESSCGQLYVYYQPIIVLATGKVAGLEALIRWVHPQRGLVSPALFIPIAEESGLVGEIGEWVLLESCRQLKRWQDKFPYLSRLKMSVNLSSRQLAPQLCDRVDSILAETGISGQSLKLEITETAIMEDPESAISIFQELKKRQIELSIDDFGTGYCSLGYLHRFPVDALKIDRSFVQKISEWGENDEIIYTIVALANSLGLETIAEGIEEIDQIQQLKALHCDFGQGFLFSKALDSLRATELLTENEGFVVMPNLHEV